MAKMEEGSVSRKYLSKILPAKLLSFAKDVLTPSERLLGNNLNDRLRTIETS